MKTITTNIFATIALMFMMLPSQRVNAQSLIAQADSAYNATHYEDAVKLYSAAIDSLGSSSDLYYNLGNSYYRTGRPGLAILCYERALRLNPGNKEAAANLEFVGSKITDRPGDRGTLLSQMLDAVSGVMTPNAWAYVALALFVLSLSAAGLYVFSSTIALRKLGFFGGIVLVLVTCFAIFIAVRAAADASDPDVAIVIEPSAIMSTSPREPKNRAEEAMLIHEGTKVFILDSINAGTDTQPELWLDVETDNTHRAWIKATAVERL